MSDSKKIATIIFFLISSLMPLKTSAMQPDLNLTSTRAEIKNITSLLEEIENLISNRPEIKNLTPLQEEIIKRKKREITLKALEIFEKFFTHHYGILLKFYDKEQFIENIEHIEKYQNELEKEEKKYYLFFENIENRYEEEYQNLNSKIINNITKIKNIIAKIKKTEEPKEKITKNNTIENMINLLNKEIKKVDEQTKKCNLYNKSFINNKTFMDSNKENIDNINNNIKKEIENIETDTKKKIINFSKLEEYKKTFSEYNKNLTKKQQDINKIKNKIKEYNSFFETISKEDNIVYNKINSEIKYIIDDIKKNFNLIELEKYKRIFSEYYEKFPLKKDNELFSIYYKNNKEKIYDIMEEINNKIPEYNSFIEKIKNQDNKQYNKLIKKIDNILSISAKPDITFFENLKNTKISPEIYEAEKKLFDLENTIKDIEKLFTKIFTDKTNIQKLETKDLFDKKLRFIEQNSKPAITFYKEYAKEIKEKYKKEPYFFIFKKILNNYDSFETMITTNLMVTLNFLYDLYKKIEKNLNENEKENYKNRLATLTTFLSENNDKSDNEFELDIEEASDSISDELNLSN